MERALETVLKMKFKTVLIIIALTSGLIAGINEATEEAAQTIRKFMRKHFIPGLSVTVANKGRIVWSQGFGYADKGNSEPVTPDTRMRIGSVSKTVTAAGVAILYEKGLLDLDAPVQKYVPSFPEKRWPITTRELMGHIAGVRHYRGDEMLNNQFYPSVTAGLEIFSADTLLFQPRTGYSYSSYAWNLVSAIMENVAKQDFLTFMERNVFNPLGLYSISPEHRDSSLTNLATFYNIRPLINIADFHFFNIRREAPYVDNSYKWAGGGFVSNTRDLVIFGLAHFDETILNKETISYWQTSMVTTDGESTNYGLGWRMGETESGGRWVGHSGGSVGGRAMLILIPEEEFVIAILVNSAPGGSLRQLSLDVSKHFLE